MSDTIDIQETEELNLPGTQEAAEKPEQPDLPEEQQPESQEFEVVLNDDEKQKQDPDTNKKFAARRIARKRQRELEHAAEAVQRGELPENLRVKPELPPQPAYIDYLSEQALVEKYGCDTNRALAAFQTAQNEWQLPLLRIL